MLNGIPNIISPELLKVLMEMGHGDEIVIADGNFPAASNSKILIRADGHNAIDILEAILSLFPLDSASDSYVSVMKTDTGEIPSIWNSYMDSILNYGYSPVFEEIERSEFYKRSEKAFAVIATSESALYSNLILKKGVL